MSKDRFKITFFCAFFLASTAWATQEDLTCAKSLIVQVKSIFGLSTRIAAPSNSPLEAVFRESYFSDFKLGHCHENIATFLRKAIDTIPNINRENLNVLLITRPSSSDFPSTTLVSGGGREGAVGDLFHVVVESEGYIYDLSFADQPKVVSKRDYFQKMFVAAAPLLKGAKDFPTQARRQLELERLNAARMSSVEQVQSELQIEIIPSQIFINSFAAEITNNIGRVSFFWNTAGNRVHMPLWKYLNLPARPKVAVASHARPDPTLAHQSKNVSVTVNPEALEVGNHQQTQNAVTVSRPGSSYPTNYNRSNRPLEELRYFYSERMLDLNELSGKVVVDMATGGGLFVEELREAGISAFGLEIAFSQRQTKNVYQPSVTQGTFDLDVNKPGIFILGDAKNTRIADQQVDVIYDTYGLTEYEFFKDKNFLRSVYTEWHRILKVGGVIRFSPLDETYVEEVRKFVNSIPGLELASAEKTRVDGGYARSFEIKKVR
jgi:ubiquinone/menaquinone biosynthesis C-methylase UbiE